MARRACPGGPGGGPPGAAPRNGRHSPWRTAGWERIHRHTPLAHRANKQNWKKHQPGGEDGRRCPTSWPKLVQRRPGRPEAAGLCGPVQRGTCFAPSRSPNLARQGLAICCFRQSAIDQAGAGFGAAQPGLSCLGRAKQVATAVAACTQAGPWPHGLLRRRRLLDLCCFATGKAAAAAGFHPTGLFLRGRLQGAQAATIFPSVRHTQWRTWPQGFFNAARFGFSPKCVSDPLACPCAGALASPSSQACERDRLHKAVERANVTYETCQIQNSLQKGGATRPTPADSDPWKLSIPPG